MSSCFRLTNANFAKDYIIFKIACEIADVEPTRRQASKYRRGLGRASKISAPQINQHLGVKDMKDE